MDEMGSEPADHRGANDDAAMPDPIVSNPSVSGASVSDPAASDPAASDPAVSDPAASPVTARSTPPVIAANILTRATEIALIVVGLWFIFVSWDDELVWLAIWDGLAFLYLAIGVIVLRRTRLQPARTRARAPILHRYRFNFAFAMTASLLGLTAAIDIAVSENPADYAVLLEILGTMAMVMSWMLLQAGYARRYAAMYFGGEGGLTFPSTDHPAPVDFLYFAVTIGTAFSVSDVLVTNARMRWHVMVHSVVSFFYNAAVVAFALNLIAGR